MHLLLYIVVLLLLLPFSANAEDIQAWTGTDTALELTYQVLRLVDRNQTLEIAKHPETRTEGCIFLDEHPSTSEVNQYMALLSISHALISYALPKPYRTAWQAVTIIDVGTAVNHNRQAGLAISFSF